MAVVNYITRVEDGTKTAPAYSFRQDTDTGVYRIGVNNLGLSAGDTKVLDATATLVTVPVEATFSLGFNVTGDPGAGVGAFRFTSNSIIIQSGTTAINFADSTNSTTNLSIRDGGNVRIAGVAPILFIGASTTNANMTVGLTINQGAADDHIVALKSSDVAHGLTTLAETDTYGLIRKSGGGGGTLIRGLVSTGASSEALALYGTSVDAASTTKSTGGYGVISLSASVKSGTTNTVVGADGNLVSIMNHTTTRFIFDAEGSAHADVEWTTYDAHNDLAVIEDMETLLAPDLVRRQFGQVIAHDRGFFEREGLLHDVREVEPGRWRGMLNTTKAMMLAFGAIRQLGAQNAALAERLGAAETHLLEAV